ncbi:MAG: fumarylacetoacetate hydrolase family protein [Verrucomicrobiota bacterium]
MRLATLQPSAQKEAVPAVAAPDGTWIPLAEIRGTGPHPLAEHLPGVLEHATRLAERTAVWTGPRLHPGEIGFLPPILRPPAFRDFYAFEAHVRTARAKRGLEVPAAWYELPVFYFSNHNALVGHDAAIFAPAGCQELDYELELGVVIGRGGRDIPPERAWEHVAGFTILNDLSARDLQRREMTVGLGPAKGKDFATAVGPWLATRDEFADRIEGERLTLAMSARVNGRELSRGNTADLHHPIPRLVAQASRDAELFPGDLLGTGTVGTGCILELGPEHTGGWLEPGDTVELEIERLGVLRTRIAPRPAVTG